MVTAQAKRERGLGHPLNKEPQNAHITEETKPESDDEELTDMDDGFDLGDSLVATMYEQSDDEEILNTEEEVEVEVALDSGCVKHCFGKEDLPKAVQRKIRPPSRDKRFHWCRRSRHQTARFRAN